MGSCARGAVEPLAKPRLVLVRHDGKAVLADRVCVLVRAAVEGEQEVLLPQAIAREEAALEALEHGRLLARGVTMRVLRVEAWLAHVALRLLLLHPSEEGLAILLGQTDGLDAGERVARWPTAQAAFRPELQQPANLEAERPHLRWPVCRPNGGEAGALPSELIAAGPLHERRR